MRGRNSGNYSRGLPSSPSYSNQPQQYYHNNNNNNRNQPSAGSRQRQNSNRTNHNRQYRDNQSYREEKRVTSATSNNVPETDAIPAGTELLFHSFCCSSIYVYDSYIENRPRLQLLPRSQKLSSSDDKPPSDQGARNKSIFGSGKLYDEIHTFL